MHKILVCLSFKSRDKKCTQRANQNTSRQFNGDGDRVNHDGERMCLKKILWCDL